MKPTKTAAGEPLSPFVETKNLTTFANKTGNLYEAISIVSKRANQLNVKLKEELHSKLAEFASTSDNLEEVFENREQIEISKFYEKMPNPAIRALQEFMEGSIYYRNPSDEEEENAE